MLREKFVVIIINDYIYNMFRRELTACAEFASDHTPLVSPTVICWKWIENQSTSKHSWRITVSDENVAGSDKKGDWLHKSTDGPIGHKNFPAGAVRIYFYAHDSWHVRLCLLVYPVSKTSCWYNIYFQRILYQQEPKHACWVYLDQSFGSNDQQPDVRVCAKEDKIVLLIKDSPSYRLYMFRRINSLWPHKIETYFKQLSLLGGEQTLLHKEGHDCYSSGTIYLVRPLDGEEEINEAFFKQPDNGGECTIL